MTAMDVLTDCRWMVRETAILKTMIDDLDGEIAGRSIILSPGRSAPIDKLGLCIARKDELERRLKAIRVKRRAENKAGFLLTSCLPPTQKKSMRFFYLKGMSAEAIAEELHYSISAIYKALAAGRKAMRMVPEQKVEDTLFESGWQLKAVSG